MLLYRFDRVQSHTPGSPKNRNVFGVMKEYARCRSLAERLPKRRSPRSLLARIAALMLLYRFDPVSHVQRGPRKTSCFLG